MTKYPSRQVMNVRHLLGCDTIKDSLINVSELHHCKSLMANKSREDISYVLVDTNQRLLSNLMRGNCPLLENMLFSTHLAEQPGFWQQAMLLPQRKQQKTTNLLSQRHFHSNTFQAESSNFKSFQFRHYHPWKDLF